MPAVGGQQTESVENKKAELVLVLLESRDNLRPTHTYQSNVTWILCPAKAAVWEYFSYYICLPAVSAELYGGCLVVVWHLHSELTRHGRLLSFWAKFISQGWCSGGQHQVHGN